MPPSLHPGHGSHLRTPTGCRQEGKGGQPRQGLGWRDSPDPGLCKGDTPASWPQHSRSAGTQTSPACVSRSAGQPHCLVPAPQAWETGPWGGNVDAARFLEERPVSASDTLVGIVRFGAQAGQAGGRSQGSESRCGPAPLQHTVPCLSEMPADTRSLESTEGHPPPAQPWGCEWPGWGGQQATRPCASPGGGYSGPLCPLPALHQYSSPQRPGGLPSTHTLPPPGHPHAPGTENVSAGHQTTDGQSAAPVLQTSPPLRLGFSTEAHANCSFMV